MSECTDSKISSESVVVLPGIFPATMIVAPNSPTARAKARTIPAMMPREASGSVMVKKTRASPAPECSRDLFEALIDGLESDTRGTHQERKRHDSSRSDNRPPGEDDVEPQMLLQETTDSVAAGLGTLREASQWRPAGARAAMSPESRPRVFPANGMGQRPGHCQAKWQNDQVLSAHTARVKPTICHSAGVGHMAKILR